MNIKCGNCKNYHDSIDEVKACQGIEDTTVTKITSEELEALLNTVPVQTRKARKITWEAKEVIVKLEQFDDPKVNPNSGSVRLDLVLTIVGTSYKAFQNLSLTGGTLDSIDRMVCKFTGNLLTDTVENCTLACYVDAIQSMVGEEFRAYVIQDTDGFLRAPLTLSQGRPGWKPGTQVAEQELANA